ncbi:MAG TPA: diphthine--ammonia ligase [Candidatus Nitrosotalea sp.]|nr:diphthine--ammonia ligase [Candidatus Nitrosotalea sp.]
MKLAALFSGGKDSTYAIFKSKSDGHTISCLVTIFPKSDESHLLHHPNIEMTRVQAKLMHIPQITASAASDETDAELVEIKNALTLAKRQYGIEGVVHGGIRSMFQKRRFEEVCSNLGLEVLSPLWGIHEASYLRDLVNSGFQFIMTSVTAGGLDDSWLGREISMQDVERLISISSKHGLNASFEGGEAETFVLGCPLFSGRIRIVKSSKTWDGYRGRFEITEAALEEQC